jgi:hypothetical protein
MNIAEDKAREIFARAVELQKMLIEAQDDLKQLRTDAIDELIEEGMDRDLAKAIRADLSEIVALAKIEAKGNIEREKVAAKMARRREVADVVGVQLDIFGAPTRMARAAAASAKVAAAVRNVFGKTDGVKVEMRTGDGELIARGDGKGSISTTEPEPPAKPEPARWIDPDPLLEIPDHLRVASRNARAAVS